jgi:hypothetical protein
MRFRRGPRRLTGACPLSFDERFRSTNVPNADDGFEQEGGKAGSRNLGLRTATHVVFGITPLAAAPNPENLPAFPPSC